MRRVMYSLRAHAGWVLIGAWRVLSGAWNPTLRPIYGAPPLDPLTHPLARSPTHPGRHVRGRADHHGRRGRGWIGRGRQGGVHRAHPQERRLHLSAAAVL